MKFRIAACICAVCILFSGCSPVVRGPRDELRLFAWEDTFDNGNTVTLTFSGAEASFDVSSKDYTLHICGLCSISDDSFVIIDGQDGVSYSFAYALTGDSIQLTYRGDSVRLKKKVEK